MITALDISPVKRVEPDFPRLLALLDRGIARQTQAQHARISDAQLGRAIGYSTAVIYGLRRHHKWPEIGVLVALADYFDDPREEWLEAGGFELASLPRDRGYTTLEREIIRDWHALSPDDQQEVRELMREVRENTPEPPPPS